MELMKIIYKILKLNLKNIYHKYVKKDKTNYETNKNIDILDIYIDKYLYKQEKDLQNVSLL